MLFSFSFPSPLSHLFSLFLHLYLTILDSFSLFIPFTSFSSHFFSLYKPYSLPFVSSIRSFSSVSLTPPHSLSLSLPFMSLINFPILCVLSLCLPFRLPLWPLFFLSLYVVLSFSASFSFCLSSMLFPVISLINFLIFSSLHLSPSVLSLTVSTSLSATDLPCSGLSAISLIHQCHQSDLQIFFT